MKYIFILFLLAFFVVSPIKAQDSYMVRNIAVDAEGKNAIDAKDKALNRARRNGFETLVKRLGVDSSTLSADDRSIATMVNSFEINREKSSKNRYLASVNVLFNQNAVQAYLGRRTNMMIGDAALNSINHNVLGGGAYSHPSVTTPMVTQNANMMSYKAEVVINGIGHLVDLKRKISRIPTLGNVSLTSIKSNRAVIDMRYSGDVEGLKTELMHRGMQLLPNRMVGHGNVPYVLTARR